MNTGCKDTSMPFGRIKETLINYFLDLYCFYWGSVLHLLYEQIKEGIRRLLLTNAIAADEKLPSVRELASMLAINPNTIQRAYKELESEGYVYSMKGKGTFASATDFIHKSREQELLMTFDDVVTELFVLDVTQEELGCRMNNLKQGRLDVNG